MKRLKELTGALTFTTVRGNPDIPVGNLCFDSRMIVPGDLFFAVRGTRTDGHDHIPMALEAGAAAIVCEHLPENPQEGIAWLVTDNTARALGFMASSYFGNPSAQLKLVGVTGTNGKTTTATLLHELFLELGYGAGLISTIVNKVNREEVPATHTTPDPVSLNALMAGMVENGCAFCFMEVSSHAVDQERIAGLTFAGGIFTNLTHDHLDYHKTFDAYLKAKKGFFDGLPADAFALVNRDDRNGLVMLQNCRAKAHTLSLHSMADFRCRLIDNSVEGLHLQFDGREGWFRLTGEFNAYNLLTVYAAAALLGQDRDDVLRILSGAEPVPGRFNLVRSQQGVTGIVDYAHTPDALKNVLDTIRQIRTGHEQVITVVGAGGNRDVAKRPVMARIAASLSDRVILTSDNPRDEDPEEIIRAMLAGLEPGQAGRVVSIVNRLEAIRTACVMARTGDIILVAGKGHETYQEVKGIRHHFDDREVLAGCFEIEPTEKP